VPVVNATRSPYRSAVWLILLLAATAAAYVSAGVTRAYLAADDFQWLEGGFLFHWSRIFNQIAGDHFYRPVIDVWFGGATLACGSSTACYHLLNLGLHFLNVALVFSLALLLFDDLFVASLGALMFALQPGYTQAIVWISAVTAVLMTTFYVTSLVFQAMSWRANGTRRVAYELLAVAAFIAAIFSHEAAMTLPVVSWIMWRLFAPKRLETRRVMAGGLAAGVALFAATTVLANHRNAVFTESRYALGAHMLRHALDYLVALYVGPGWWLSYTVAVAVVLLLLAATRATRFGAAWLIISMMPYLGFTAGNVSRYLYLPSIGFSLGIAAAVAAAGGWLSRRDVASGASGVSPASRRMVQGGMLVVALFITVRYARFDVASVRSQVKYLEPWRTFADALAANTHHAAAGSLHVALPPGTLEDKAADVKIDEMYVVPIAKWVYQDYGLNVVIDH
jgi:hypothetical protein